MTYNLMWYPTARDSFDVLVDSLDLHMEPFDITYAGLDVRVCKPGNGEFPLFHGEDAWEYGYAHAKKAITGKPLSHGG